MRGFCCVLALVLSVAAGTKAPACKSDSGSDVDFAYSFKYDKGWDYAYMDSDHKLAKSSHQLNSADSSITQTLLQMNDAGVSHVLWNDQPPPKKSTSQPRAHAKGALVFNEEGGIWLTHSLPHFPDVGATTASELWTSGSNDFGQTYLCITLTAEEIHKLSPVMEITRVVVYDTKWATGAEDKFDDVSKWAQEKGPEHDDKDMTTKVSIKSKGGQEFTFFGKSGHWGLGKDLYHDLVAPALGPLFMEGWRRGAGVWGPACGKNEVLDITEVAFPGDDWTTTHDHSKWAITQSASHFCVGDINRAKGQDRRGGGTVCIQDSGFAKQVKNVIKTTDKCSDGLVIV